MSRLTSRSESIPGYLYILDGLRAVSLILVVLFHTWQHSWITPCIKLNANTTLLTLNTFQRYGYVAIDSFFVLSGFCLFYPIARDMFGEKRFGGWKDFFIKRARRIYPSYLLMLLLVIIFPVLSDTSGYDPKNAAETAKQFFYHLVFIHNLEHSTLVSTVSTAWTLAVEVHFYLIFPLLCIPFRKKPVLTAAGMCAAAVIIRLSMMAGMNISPRLYSAITPAYFDVFGLGMLSAYFVVKLRHSGIDMKKLRPDMTAISVLCIAAAVYYMIWLGSAHSGFPKGYAFDVYFRFLYRGLFSALIALFILTGAYSYDLWQKRIWGNKFFVFLSSISYTVYLWHQNLLIFEGRINFPYASGASPADDRAGMEMRVLFCIAASIVIGVLVTKFIEGPIVKYGVKGCIKRLAAPLTEKENKNGRKGRQ